MTTYLITRHPGARQWVQEEGIVVDAQLDHLEVDQVRAGDIVVGSLPVNLAAEVCARGGRYFHLSLERPFDWRGRELSPDDMRRFGARLEEFRVEPLPLVGSDPGRDASDDDLQPDSEPSRPGAAPTGARRS